MCSLAEPDYKMNKSKPRARTEDDTRLFFQLAPTTLYLVVFFTIPGCVLLLYSFCQKKGFSLEPAFTLENYWSVLTTALYVRVILNSLAIGLCTALLAVLISYPLAYGLRFKLRKYQRILLLLIFVSVVGSYLVRIYAWKSILGNQGLINEILLYANIIQEPLAFLVFNRFAVIITLTNLFIPSLSCPFFGIPKCGFRCCAGGARSRSQFIAGPVSHYLPINAAWSCRRIHVHLHFCHQ